MGTLTEPTSGRRITLGPRMLVGRAPACLIRLEDPLVSGEHASFCWRKDGWELRDLGSRNGTWVDADRIPRGGRSKLIRGSVIAFGSTKLVWYLTDDGPPIGVARELDSGRIVQAEGGLLVLPDDDAPEATIYQNDRGWVLEESSAMRPVVDQEVVGIGGRRWALELPVGADLLAETTLSVSKRWLPLSTVGLRFDVSLDQEHVSVTLLSEEPDRALAGRAFHELLLVLARARLNDRARGVPEPECGWVYNDDLTRMLAQETAKVNVDIFRVRQQLQKLGVSEAQNIVERRGTTRQVRIGVEWLEVVDLSRMSTPP